MMKKSLTNGYRNCLIQLLRQFYKIFRYQLNILIRVVFKMKLDICGAPIQFLHLGLHTLHFRKKQIQLFTICHTVTSCEFLLSVLNKFIISQHFSKVYILLLTFIYILSSPVLQQPDDGDSRPRGKYLPAKTAKRKVLSLHTLETKYLYLLLNFLWAWSLI